MPVNRPERRIVTAEDVIQDQVDAFETPEVPEARTRIEKDTRELTYRERLHRRLRMSDLALERYEEKLEKGAPLTPEEERLFLAHQNSVRQLEATLAALEHKDVREAERSEQEIAQDLKDAGWSLSDLETLFKHNPDVLEKLV